MVCDNAVDYFGELEVKVALVASLTMMKLTNKKEFGFWLFAMEEWAAVEACEMLLRN